MNRTQHRELFLFAAKVGALEGYLYRRRKPEPLDDWVNNISRMYHELSPVVKREVAPVLVPLLERTLKYGARALEPGLREKLQQLLVAAGKAD